MKKLFLGAAVLAMITAGCQNDVLVEQETNEGGQLMTLVVNKGMDSRTALGTDNATWWSEGDQIYVSGQNGKVTGVLKLIEGKNSASGKFQGYIFGGDIIDLQHLVFPVPEGGTTIDMSARTPGKLDAPMVGTISGNTTASLNNVGGIIAFKSDKSYDVRAMKDGKNMAAGSYTFNPTTGTLTYVPGDEDNSTPTYKPEGSKYVYVPVATTTQANNGSSTESLSNVKVEALQNGAVISSATVDVTPNEIEGDEINETTLKIDYWDGTITKPKDKEGVIEINSAAELAGLAAMVNEGNTLEGKTVYLMTNIDLNNIAWTPIGPGSYNDKTKGFKGTFNGNNKIISNLKIEVPIQLNAKGTALNENLRAGFININRGVIENVTFANAYIKGGKHVAVVVGYNTGSINNVKVENSIIEGCYNVGGIVATAYNQITNSKVINTKLTANYYQLKNGNYEGADNIGGVVGVAYGTVINCIADNLVLNAYRDVAGIVGALMKDATSVANNEVKTRLVINLDTTEEKNYKNFVQDDPKRSFAQIVADNNALSSVVNNNTELTLKEKRNNTFIYE